MSSSSHVSMGLLLYSVIFTGQASLGTRGHLIHNSNDALAPSPAGPGMDANESNLTAKVARKRIHVTMLPLVLIMISSIKKFYNIMHNMVVRVRV